MISKDNLSELDIIARLFAIKPYKGGPVFDLFQEAMYEAIETTEFETATKYIMINYPSLSEVFLSVVKEKYPDKFEEIQKLMVLM
jgi:hypothetical protein